MMHGSHLIKFVLSATKWVWMYLRLCGKWGGGELSRCYEECKRLQSHSNGLDEHELRSVNYLASITVIEVRHTTVMH